MRGDDSQKKDDDDNLSSDKSDKEEEEKGDGKEGGRGSRRGRGRGRGGRKVSRGRKGRGRGRGGGTPLYNLGSRVKALWADENKYYNATVSGISFNGTYGITFDISNDREFKAYENQLQPLRYYTFEKDQEVKALFFKDDRWYSAKVVEVLETGRYKVKFDHLDKEFEQRADQIRPVLKKGTRVMALWFKNSKYMAATIIGEDAPKREKGVSGATYTIKFDERTSEFSGTRPDNIMELDTFEKDEEMLALWGQDGLYYPAKVVAVGTENDEDEDDDDDDEDKSEKGSDDGEEEDEEEKKLKITKHEYLIKFDDFNRTFKARAQNLKKKNIPIPPRRPYRRRDNRDRDSRKNKNDD